MPNTLKTFPPVYVESMDYAYSLERENKNDIDLFMQSNRLSRECAVDINRAIAKDDNDIEKAFITVMEKYGAERVSVVATMNINQRVYDGRISNENKQWASGIRTPENKLDFSVNLSDMFAKGLDGFFDKVREAYENAMEIYDGRDDFEKEMGMKAPNDFGVYDYMNSEFDYFQNVLPQQREKIEVEKQGDNEFKDFISQSKAQGICDEDIEAAISVIKELRSKQDEQETKPITPEKNSDDGDINFFKEALPMKVKAAFYPNEKTESALKGTAIVSIGDQFSFPVKVFENEKKELNISMPDKHNKKGNYVDVVVPATKEAYAAVKEAVLEAVKNPVIKGQELPPLQSEPVDVSVGIYGFKENTNMNSKTQATCDIVIGKNNGKDNNITFNVKGASVYANDNGELGVNMPSRMDEEGKYHSIAKPITSEMHSKIKETVLEGFEDFQATRGNIGLNQLETNCKEAGGKADYITINNMEFAKTSVIPALREAGVDFAARNNANNSVLIASTHEGMGIVKDIIKEAQSKAPDEIDTSAEEKIATGDMEDFIAGSEEIIKESEMSAEKESTDIDDR